MANERNDNIKKGVHGCSREDKYIAPTDPLIKERLEWFQDQKLALMMHFGPYAQMGVNVSWPLSAADDWARCDMDWEEDLDTFREQYVNLNKSFNPMRLQPKKWAEFAKDLRLGGRMGGCKKTEGELPLTHVDMLQVPIVRGVGAIVDGVRRIDGGAKQGQADGLVGKASAVGAPIENT